jgi:hypothetical protein
MRRGDTNVMGDIDHSICPSAPIPAPVLAVVMNGGSYLLFDYPQSGPSAYVAAEDAVPLRQAFGSEQSANNKVAVPVSDLMRGEAAQP